MNLRSLRFALPTLVALVTASVAHAQLSPSPNPIVITQPGVYILNRDIRVQNGDAITVRASGVTLDLNGHSVSTATPSTAPFGSRGIFVDGSVDRLKAVTVKGGKVGSFSVNVAAMNVEALVVSEMQVVGENAAPAGGPTEVGIMLINSRGAKIKDNSITSVNLGIFVRGGGSTGNTISNNTVLGGETGANNLLGICYNPAPGANAVTDGPSGDLIYNNHITRYGFGIAISAASRANIFRENVLASLTGGFREPNRLVTNGGTNVDAGNIAVVIPSP